MDALLCPKLLEEELFFFLTVRFEICPQLQNVEGPLKNAPLKNPWLLVDYSMFRPFCSVEKITSSTCRRMKSLTRNEQKQGAKAGKYLIYLCMPWLELFVDL